MQIAPSIEYLRVLHYAFRVEIIGWSIDHVQRKDVHAQSGTSAAPSTDRRVVRKRWVAGYTGIR